MTMEERKLIKCGPSESGEEGQQRPGKVQAGLEKNNVCHAHCRGKIGIKAKLGDKRLRDLFI